MNELLKDLDVNNLPFHIEFDDFILDIILRTAYTSTSIYEMENNSDYIKLPTIKLTHIPSQKGLYLYSKEAKTKEQIIDLAENALDYFKRQYLND